tara:strand:- start:55 stop:462 length:408 start_codon:yes stop_codon:yes gene_type:complete
MPDLRSEELKSELTQFYGTENYYAHKLPLCNEELILTDGVKYWAEKVGESGYCFLDIVLTEIMPHINDPENNKGPYPIQNFACVELDVIDGKADIRFGDGSGETRVWKKIKLTDCPAGTWSFWIEGGVMLLPSEH